MQAQTVTGPGIERFRWVTLRSGLKLEKLGMKKRGPSCRTLVLEASGLPNRTSYEDLITWCDEKIKEYDHE